MKAYLFILTISAIAFSCSTPKTEEAIVSQNTAIATSTEALESNLSNRDTADTILETTNVPDLVAEKPSIFTKLYVGMKIEDVKQLYKGATIKNLPNKEYGLGNIENGLLIIDNNEPQFYILYSKGDKTVNGISILSPSIHVEGGIHVGITYAEFVKLKPKSSLAIDSYQNNLECMYVPEKKYRVEFLTTEANRVGKYDNSSGSPEIINVARPESKIERISLY